MLVERTYVSVLVKPTLSSSVAKVIEYMEEKSGPGMALVTLFKTIQRPQESRTGMRKGVGKNQFRIYSTKKILRVRMT